MKKIAVMGSGNGSNFETIVRYFSEKNVDITCLSDNKDAFILARAKKLNVEHKYLPFENNFEYFNENKFDLIILAGYMKIFSEDVLDVMGQVINIHPSLLPSFTGKDAIKKAFLAGVKVTGITIHWVDKKVDSGKIIAQYPVFITNDMHLDDLESAIHNVEHKLYPVVIEQVLNDKVFDFNDLMKSGNESSGAGCGGGCGKCGH